jgi:hypothetical protein
VVIRAGGTVRLQIGPPETGIILEAHKDLLLRGSRWFRTASLSKPIRPGDLFLFEE